MGSPLDYGPVLLLKPFRFHLTVDTLPSGCLATVPELRTHLGCFRRFRLRARLGLSLSEHPGQRGITPAFGYGAPYPSASGTLTHQIWALPSTHYEPLRLPRRPGAISVLTLYPPVGRSGPPPPRISRPALFLFHCMPPLLPREIRWNASVLSFHRQRPSPSDHRVGISSKVTRLPVGSLSLRPATLPLGNLQPPIARTLLPGARKVYGQLLSRDLNPQDKQPLTAYGQVFRFASLGILWRAVERARPRFEAQWSWIREVPRVF